MCLLLWELMILNCGSICINAYWRKRVAFMNGKKGTATTRPHSRVLNLGPVCEWRTTWIEESSTVVRSSFRLKSSKGASAAWNNVTLEWIWQISATTSSEFGQHVTVGQLCLEADSADVILDLCSFEPDPTISGENSDLKKREVCLPNSNDNNT